MTLLATPLPVTPRSRDAYQKLRVLLGAGELAAHVVHVLEEASCNNVRRKVLAGIPELQLDSRAVERLLFALGYLEADACAACARVILPGDQFVFDKSFSRIWCSLDCFRGQL